MPQTQQDHPRSQPHYITCRYPRLCATLMLIYKRMRRGKARCLSPVLSTSAHVRY